MGQNNTSQTAGAASFRQHSPQPQKTKHMNQIAHELKGLTMFSVASILNVLSMIDRSTITFVLGTITSVVVIVYYTVAISEKIRNQKQKHDVGEDK